MPRAVVVRGEAGVGKTRLVSAVCDRARERDVTVLWGTCVRFGAIESTFLPWVMAVERWLASAAEADRQRVLAEVPQAAQLLPSLGGGGSGTDAVRLMRVLKALVTSIGARGPTVLVMDDVQWADPASRDVLTYLLAGLANERLLVLATVRDEGVPAEDPVHGWLADLRRLPSVAELPLARLSLEETADQVAVPARCGAGVVAGPRMCMTAPAGTRTWSSCSATTSTLVPQSLPEGVPEDLSRALLEVWYRLSEPAREAARILAVAGRPVPLARLEQACAATAETTAASVRSAVGGGHRRGRHGPSGCRSGVVPAPVAGRGAADHVPARGGGAGPCGLGRPARPGHRRGRRGGTPARRPGPAPRGRRPARRMCGRLARRGGRRPRDADVAGGGGTPGTRSAAVAGRGPEHHRRA